jgi:hypothetical protein
MVWHIFKKDWRLVWIFALIVTAVHWTDSAIIHKLGLFNEDPTLGMLAEAIPILAFFASMFLIAAIVHLDAIPGVRQDWLVRPVLRRDLLIEKFLFVVLIVNGPVFLEVLWQGLANRFSFRLSLAAAAYQLIFLLFAFTLPLFSFASVTENMTQAFIFGYGCAFLIAAFLSVASDLNTRAHGTLESISWSAVGWVGETARFVLILAMAVIILGLQYFQRKTALSRGLVLVFGFAILAIQFLPWKTAFAIEKKFSAQPNAAMDVTVAFDAGLAKFKSPSGLGAFALAERAQRYAPGEHASVFLPLRIAGLPSDVFLLSDRVEVQLFDASRKTLYHGIGENVEMAREGPEPVVPSIHQQIQLPGPVYHDLKDQPIRAEIDYSLTLFALRRSYAIPALGGDERMPGFGWCQTKMNEAETAVELHCMQPGKGPTCATLFLENQANGQRNPIRSSCHGDYSPYSGWYFGDNLALFGGYIPFRDASGLAKFPVDGPQLPQSRIIIRVYEPEDHFTRSLMIPSITLKNWESQ